MATQSPALDTIQNGHQAATAPARRRATETKAGTKTTEFMAFVAVTVGVLIAGLLTKAGDQADDRFVAQDVWTLVAILTVGYMVSRGLAKSGSREPYTDDSH